MRTRTQITARKGELGAARDFELETRTNGKWPRKENHHQEETPGEAGRRKADGTKLGRRGAAERKRGNRKRTGSKRPGFRGRPIDAAWGRLRNRVLVQAQFCLYCPRRYGRISVNAFRSAKLFGLAGEISAARFRAVLRGPRLYAHFGMSGHHAPGYALRKNGARNCRRSQNLEGPSRQRQRAIRDKTYAALSIDAADRRAP